MNAVVPFASAGLVPSNMSEAMRLAEMMATAKLVPVALQKSPADCLMVIQQAIRWDMDPFAVAQECSVIQGKLMHSGKLVAAVVNARGNLAERLSFSYEGEGDNRTITVTGRLQGELSPRTVSVRLSEAKTNNKVWQTQPDQQLMYHGTRVWARRHTPELMLGVYSPEEFDAKLPPHNPHTGEITQSDGAELAPPFDATDAAPLAVGSPGGAAVSLEDMAREAALRGEAVFRKFYKQRTGPEQARINAIGDELRGLMDGDMPDDNTEHMKRIEAFKRGQAARSAGYKRQSLPGEYREDDRAREGLCWTAGFDGSAMPEFGD
jgi:RecT family